MILSLFSVTVGVDKGGFPTGEHLFCEDVAESSSYNEQELGAIAADPGSRSET
jgi:hypothetical protein